MRRIARIKRNMHEFFRSYNFDIIRHWPAGFDRFLLSKYGDVIGAEIGVHKGDHINYWLQFPRIKHIHLIDSYESYDRQREILSKAYSHDMKRAHKIIQELIKKNNERLLLYKESSDTAHKKFKNESLDFVYIDAGHAYEQIKKDIANYYPKVRQGGMLGGHDFSNGVRDETKGVVKAVMEFVAKNNLKLYVHLLDWWVVKGETIK